MPEATPKPKASVVSVSSLSKMPVIKAQPQKVASSAEKFGLGKFFAKEQYGKQHHKTGAVYSKSTAMEIELPSMALK